MKVSKLALHDLSADSALRGGSLFVASNARVGWSIVTNEKMLILRSYLEERDMPHLYDSHDILQCTRLPFCLKSMVVTASRSTGCQARA